MRDIFTCTEKFRDWIWPELFTIHSTVEFQLPSSSPGPLKPFLDRFFLSLSLKFIDHLTGSTNVHVVEVSSTSGGQRPPSLPRKPTGSTRPDLISPSAPPFEGKFHSANNGSSTSVLPARDTSSSKADTRYRQIPLPVTGVWTYWGQYFSCSFHPPLEDKWMQGN